jgi:DNA-binding SARP family transcriptional activator
VGLTYGILGPLRVGDSTGEAVVTAGRDRVLLATLLLHAGRPVALGRLVEALWGDQPPATARGQLHTCVSRLRRTLSAAGVAGDLRTHPAGYQFDVDPADLDAAEFDRLVAEARAAVDRDDPADASRRYGAALALWRGPALAGIGSRVVRAAAAALDEKRFTAVEERVDVELRLGHERELIGELTGLVQRHPLRERLRGQLMTALSRAGRRADALAVFREGRQVLAADLGIEPGPPLQELHRRILLGEEAGSPAAPRAGPPISAVRCLPRAMADFTGRAESVEFLIAGARESAHGPVVQLVDGMAGSGKTALVVHVAHLLAPEYPDAQLFVDLYGHGEREPLEPGAALVTLLRQLGVPGERIPAELDGRIALWRTELSGRRALVVLDNAASSAQVAPLLPTAAGSVALVTSRTRLLGLDGVRPRSLPLLDPEEAMALLARIVGLDRVTAETDAAADLVRRCGHLPLAIRLAGARLAHRPGWRVSDLAERLAAGSPLPELAAEERTVAGAFGQSYAPLPPASRRLFRLLGAHPGEWLDDHAAAALADLPLAETRRLLQELVDRHLVEEPDAGRYRLHDLLREYAAALAVADAEGVAAPLERLLDYYLHAVQVSSDALETQLRRGGRGAGFPRRPDLVERPAAEGMRWLERERPNLVQAVRAAGEQGLHRAGWRLAGACFRFLSVRGYLDDLLDSHRSALTSAEAAGDRAAVAMLHNYVASVHFRKGRPAEAVDHLRTAITIREDVGGHHEAAISRANLAGVYAAHGRFREALAECDRALAVVRRRSDPLPLVCVLQVLAEVHRAGGWLDEALRTSRSYLALARQLGDLALVASGLGSVGSVRRRLGHRGPAMRLLTTAIVVKRRTGNRYGEAVSLNELALLHGEEGRHTAAVALHEEALTMMREMADRHDELAILNDLGRTLRLAGDLDRAADLHRQVLGVTERFDDPYRRADAYDGLARCLLERDADAARRHWEQALRLYRRMDVPPQHEVARRLSDLRVDPGVRQR